MVNMLYIWQGKHIMVLMKPSAAQHHLTCNLHEKTNNINAGCEQVHVYKEAG